MHANLVMNLLALTPIFGDFNNATSHWQYSIIGNHINGDSDNAGERRDSSSGPGWLGPFGTLKLTQHVGCFVFFRN